MKKSPVIKKKVSTTEATVYLIKDFNLEDIAQQEYYRYGVAVNEDRSIPCGIDGFKPVHRRAIWAAHMEGLRFNSPPVKSARPVATCFVAGTMVTMEDGSLKPIEQLTVGERVKTSFGTIGDITETFIIPPANILEVKAGGKTIRCTRDQKFKVLDENGSIIWREASSLKKGDMVMVEQK